MQHTKEEPQWPTLGPKEVEGPVTWQFLWSPQGGHGGVNGQLSEGKVPGRNQGRVVGRPLKRQIHEF